MKNVKGREGIWEVTGVLGISRGDNWIWGKVSALSRGKEGT